MSSPDDGQSTPDDLFALLDLPTVTEWPGDDSLILQSPDILTAPIGSELARMPCMICGRPLAQEPFQAYALVSPIPCLRSGTHLPAVAGAAHMTCRHGDDQALGELIVTASAGCF